MSRSALVRLLGVAAVAAASFLLVTGAPVGAQQAAKKKKKQQEKKEPVPVLGYTDTPVIPGQKWRVHDIDRPRPAQVSPGAQCGQPPSDAMVLFDGRDLSKWTVSGRRKDGKTGKDPEWLVKDGYMEVVWGTGDLATKEKFGDCQLHLEWASPTRITNDSQLRANSGVLLMSRYEIQVLDSWQNPTYADGQAGAIYGWWPPLVNAARRPGEWQSYDIIFEAPRFEGAEVVKKAYVTVFHNGVLLHHRQEIGGPMAHRVVRPYQPHPPEEPLALQNHNDPVRFRNIWIRRLKGYDQP